MEEEAELRKLSSTQQRAGLESLLKRLGAQLSTADVENKEAIEDAMRYVRVQLSILSRPSLKQAVDGGANSEIVSVSKRSSPSKVPSGIGISELSGFFFRSDTIRSLAPTVSC